MTSKILTLLGFASKAGKLDYGMQKMKESLKRGSACLVVAACDLSQKSQKELLFFTHNQEVKTVILDVDIETLSTAVGRKCGIVCVNDKGFADAIFNYQEAMLNANDQ